VIALLADVTTPDPDSVTPGVVGFIVTFGVAAVTLLLVIDMVRRVRRVNYRAQVREELAAEIAANETGRSAAGSAGVAPAGAGSATDAGPQPADGTTPSGPPPVRPRTED
jgi:hypothetical protein